MPPFHRENLFKGLRALAVKLRRGRSSSKKKKSMSESSVSRSNDDLSTSSSSSGDSSHRNDIRRVFAVYDKDGDGRISLAELTDMVRALGGGQSASDTAAEEVAAMMEVTDLDRDGYIGFEEFQTLMATSASTKSSPRGGQSPTTASEPPHHDHDGARVEQGLQQGFLCRYPEQGSAGVGSNEEEAEEDLRLAFAMYDRNGDGVITAQEIHAVLRSIMETTITLADCRRMIQAVDRDGDGVVGFHDFATMMTTTQPCAY